MPTRDADGNTAGGLPALPDATRAQRFLWASAILVALSLLAALGVRIGRRVDLLQWWVPFACVAGIAAADFASGLLHWAADTWGRSDFPVLGPRILVPFRVHHLNPDDFVRRRFLDANGDVAALMIPILAGLLQVPLDTPPAPALALFGFAMVAFGGMTNQIHQWAHMPRPPAPVRLLQRARVLLSPVDHAAHHDRPYDVSYCITTGWCNRPLEAIRFFRRLEAFITDITGALPRDDEARARSANGAAHQMAEDV